MSRNQDGLCKAWAVGRIHKILTREGQTREGHPKTFYQYVLKVAPKIEGKEPSYVCFKLSKSIEFVYQEHMEIGAKVYLELWPYAREYNDKWYNDLIATTVVFDEKLDAAETKEISKAMANAMTEDEEDDLPF